MFQTRNKKKFQLGPIALMIQVGLGIKPRPKKAGVALLRTLSIELNFLYSNFYTKPSYFSKKTHVSQDMISEITQSNNSLYCFVMMMSPIITYWH